VTPYLDDVQAAIIATYAGQGIICDPERHCGLRENFAFAEVEDARIAGMVHEVAEGKPDAIAVVCTNLRAGKLVAALEAQTGILILDSVATAVWGSLATAGVNPARVNGWGRLFTEMEPRGGFAARAAP
jgi:maleate isomerase